MKQIPILSTLILLQFQINAAFSPACTRVTLKCAGACETNSVFHTKHRQFIFPYLVTSTHIITDPSVIPLSASTIVESIFSSSQTVPLPLAFAVNSSLFLVLRNKLNKMLTPEGYMHALALGTMLWYCLGWKGWSVCVLYLVLGSAVTKVKFAEKKAKGIAEGRDGRRGPENVWGSAATSLVCAAGYVQAISVSSGLFVGISAPLFVLAFTASLATKLSDTFASEIGKAYGKTTFLITTFQRVEPGTEGAVSAEGTAAAMFGAALLPIYAWLIGLIPNVNYIWIATVAAFFATNCESYIGATMQGKRGFAWMTNEVVNFVNTVIGAVTALVVASLLVSSS